MTKFNNIILSTLFALLSISSYSQNLSNKDFSIRLDENNNVTIKCEKENVARLFEPVFTIIFAEKDPVLKKYNRDSKLDLQSPYHLNTWVCYNNEVPEEEIPTAAKKDLINVGDGHSTDVIEDNITRSKNLYRPGNTTVIRADETRIVDNRIFYVS